MTSSSPPRLTKSVKTHRALPSKAELTRLFSYSFVEGALFWKERTSPKAKLSMPAGYTDPEGYKVITIAGISYRRHRLVWAYFHNDPGDLEIDHVNRIKGDDRIENLRQASRRQNSYNTIYSTNKSGCPGVCWHKRDKRWRVSIRKNGVNFHLGYFSDIEKAKQAYRKASLKLHQEFSAFSDLT
jgi:hypothetical protein